MPSCRVCNGHYPQQFFIRGNGPRHEICSRCAVDTGLVEPEEAPWLLDEGLVNRRRAALRSKWLPWTVFWFGLLVWWLVLRPAGLLAMVPVPGILGFEFTLASWLVGVPIWAGLFAAVFVMRILFEPARMARWDALVPSSNDD